MKKSVLVGPIVLIFLFGARAKAAQTPNASIAQYFSHLSWSKSALFNSDKLRAQLERWAEEQERVETADDPVSTAPVTAEVIEELLGHLDTYDETYEALEEAWATHVDDFNHELMLLHAGAEAIDPEFKLKWNEFDPEIEDYFRKLADSTHELTGDREKLRQQARQVIHAEHTKRKVFDGLSGAVNQLFIIGGTLKKTAERNIKNARKAAQENGNSEQWIQGARKMMESTVEHRKRIDYALETLLPEAERVGETNVPKRVHTSELFKRSLSGKAMRSRSQSSRPPHRFFFPSIPHHSMLRASGMR